MNATSRAAEFRRQLDRRALVSDGAMGTMLASFGVSVSSCLAELNVTEPQLVSRIHRGYAGVGAEILETNTFGANRARLNSFHLSGQLGAINQAGVQLARHAAEAAKNPCFVAGCIGPLGLTTSVPDARAIFREQAAALCQAGVDLLILETFTNMVEVQAAVFGAREAVGAEMVIVAQISIGVSGILSDGSSPQEFARQADAWPVDLLGVNCSAGPQATLDAIEALSALGEKRLSAMPSAGLPSSSGVYPISPSAMARYARRMLLAGVGILGGCCGTTPEHIRAMVSEARGW